MAAVAWLFLTYTIRVVQALVRLESASITSESLSPAALQASFAIAGGITWLLKQRALNAAQFGSLEASRRLDTALKWIRLWLELRYRRDYEITWNYAVYSTLIAEAVTSLLGGAMKMAFNQQMIEEIGAWCLNSMELASDRRQARRIFFGDDDRRPINYWGGTGEQVSRERRFLGWFMFDFALPNDEKPAAVAVKRLHTGRPQFELLRAVSQTRFVFAVVASVVQRSVYLELEDESFEVRNPVLAANVSRHQAIVAHVLPERYGYWLVGPGWFIWPMSLGPGIRSSLKQFQLDPIRVERFLQGRSESEKSHPRREAPQDKTLEEAVSRMTTWATLKGHTGLAMSADEWRSLVIKYMGKSQSTGFASEILDKLRQASSEEELQEALDLATNIWNNTPQPDRGGRTPNQLRDL